MQFLTRRVAVLFAAFVLLGVPESVLGTAWPSIRGSFDRSEAALAQLLIAYTIGYLVASIASGRVSERSSGGVAGRIGVTITVVGLLLYTVSPVWSVVVIAALVLGCGGGFVDTGINTEVALRHGQRAMNLLHAAFGVGATLGPLAVTALLALDASWRIAYATLVALELALLAALVTTERAEARSRTGAGEVAPTYAERSARPQVTMIATLVYFAFYVAAEVSVGQWSFSILSEDRGVSETVAGLSVAAYWGGLTVGRLALGVLDERLHPLRLLRGAVVVALGASVWFATNAAGSVLALPVLGLAFSGMFPGVVLMSASWLGPERLARAVGYQLAASSAGAIAAAAALGGLADTSGLDAIAPAITVLVVLLAAAHATVERTVR